MRISCARVCARASPAVTRSALPWRDHTLEGEEGGAPRLRRVLVRQKRLPAPVRDVITPDQLDLAHGTPAMPSASPPAAPRAAPGRVSCAAESP